MFGLVFGFLLQKGGVGKYNVLIGKVLLPDLLSVPRYVFVVCFAAALIDLLVVLQQFSIDKKRSAQRLKSARRAN